MMTQYPRWKVLLLVVVIGIAALYALPNLYGDDPAVQVLPNQAALVIQDELKADITEALAEADLPVKRWHQEDRELLIRFHNTTDQLKAKDLLRQRLDSHYTVALNLAPAMPSWLEKIGAAPVKLGLDLRGGVHFLMEVDVASSIQRRLDGYRTDIRPILRDAKARYQRIETLDENALLIEFDTQESVDSALSELRNTFSELEWIQDGERGDYVLIARMTSYALQDIRNYTVEQTITTLRNRVNELGVAEAVVQRQGLNRIAVELPGIQDTARAKDILGKTATLEFRMRDEEHDALTAARSSQVPKGSELFYDRYERPVLLRHRVILTGDNITGANVGTDSRDGRPVVNVRIGGAGLELFKKMTRENVGKGMGVVYIETTVNDVEVDGEETPVRVVDTHKQVISVATIQSALGSQFQISGFTLREAQDLALLLRAGALPATISIVEERTIGPSLGQENINMGMQSIVIGLTLVLTVMIFYYHLFGLLANVTLLMNLVLLVAALSWIGATLTLPGIAGIVLTLGMAVDANVLIFERIREEFRNGLSLHACLHSGFERALSTIIDSNVTTLIVGLILFSVGTGPVKGFAITLCIGILTSLFTAVMGTRALVHLVYGRNGQRKLRIGI